ncbi:hypothetical protein VNO80_10719 [Phaseolus coccineus]|uniref:Uncharacterized protein n=1 Tax=Phaseolus coccineus TaxID=3886 RepID=A0AAN9RDN9_PHACN
MNRICMSRITKKKFNRIGDNGDRLGKSSDDSGPRHRKNSLEILHNPTQKHEACIERVCYEQSEKGETKSFTDMGSDKRTKKSLLDLIDSDCDTIASKHDSFGLDPSSKLISKSQFSNEISMAYV